MFYCLSLKSVDFLYLTETVIRIFVFFCFERRVKYPKLIFRFKNLFLLFSRFYTIRLETLLWLRLCLQNNLKSLYLHSVRSTDLNKWNMQSLLILDIYLALPVNWTRNAALGSGTVRCQASQYHHHHKTDPTAAASISIHPNDNSATHTNGPKSSSFNRGGYEVGYTCSKTA